MKGCEGCERAHGERQGSKHYETQCGHCLSRLPAAAAAAIEPWLLLVLLQPWPMR